MNPRRRDVVLGQYGYGQEFLHDGDYGQEFLEDGAELYEGYGAELYEGEEFEDYDGFGQYDVYLEPAGYGEPMDMGKRLRRPRYYPQRAKRPRPTSIQSDIAQAKKQDIMRRESMKYKRAGSHVVEPETFNITHVSGSQGAVTLTANTAGTRTNIATYTVPTGYRLVFDPNDVYQECMFVPYTSAGTNDTNFIYGDFEVVAESATGGRTWRMFHSATEFMNPDKQTTSVGHRRKWQQPYVAVPGDRVRFYFTAGTAMSTDNTRLWAGVRANRQVD